jgi:hypothetical protein
MLNYRKKTSIAILTALVIATAGIDLLYSRLHATSYYLSESLLFSSFWLWFSPLLSIQYLWINKKKRYLFKTMVSVAVWVAHFILYPTGIWVFSYLFLSNTFPFKQTFFYGLTEYSLISALAYALLVPLFVLFKTKTQEQKSSNYTEYLTLTENNKTFNLNTKDIVYISANTPYVNIHLLKSKHLINQTLKGIESKLDPSQFIRIHKSYMVNIKHVISYQSRLNGDYDLTLSDHTILRLSRNYASTFKNLFTEAHHLSKE